MVLQLRIDERLTHGQVCTTWINTLKATHVIVANDQVANDDFQKSIMGMGIPSSVKSIFTTLEKAVGILNDPRSEFLKIFLVAKTPKDALYLVEHVEGIEQVNLANYGVLVKSDKKIVYSLNVFVFLDEDDVNYVKQIQNKVKSVYFQDIVGKSKKMIEF